MSNRQEATTWSVFRGSLASRNQQITKRLIAQRTSDVTLSTTDLERSRQLIGNGFWGESYLQLYTVLPNQRRFQSALIMALETGFARVQIFGDELAFAKYCQKQWRDERINQVVAGIIRKRTLN
jgi:hypothetical protein